MAERPDPPGLPGDELLGRLEERLDRASQAAERLIAEAAAAAIRRPPPAGWQPPQPDPPADPSTQGELERLLEAVLSLRDRIPPELQRRLGEALRDLLLALRALIDWYLERTERRPGGRGVVQDIPIL